MSPNLRAECIQSNPETCTGVSYRTVAHREQMEFKYSGVRPIKNIESRFNILLRQQLFHLAFVN